MIKVDDLIAWSKRIAIGRSTSYPNGWIDATALKKLAEQVEQNEPLPYKPTVDAVPVVMCRDCKHHEVFKNGVNGWCNKHECPTDVTYFCADGERRTNEKEALD